MLTVVSCTRAVTLGYTRCICISATGEMRLLNRGLVNVLATCEICDRVTREVCDLVTREVCDLVTREVWALMLRVSAALLAARMAK